MLSITIVFCLILSPVLATLAAENATDLETWKAPADIQKSFPYYLSGFDAKDQPIWIFVIGSYPLKSFVEKGPETIGMLETYMNQISHRIRKSIMAKSANNSLAGIIVDFDGLDVKQFSDSRTIDLIKKMMTKILVQIDGADTSGTSVLVNVNPLLQSLLRVAKDRIGKILDHVTIYGSKREEWIPKLVKIFPADQLPEWYGGRKGFKPLEVYG